MSAPKSSSNVAPTSAGTAAPPTCAIRRAGSLSAGPTTSDSAIHIVGTPSMTVTPASAIRSSVCRASNRRSMAIAPPCESVATMPVESPSTCENGAAPSTTSREPSWSAAAAFVDAARMLPCVSVAPFGLPDVPDVNRITAGAAGSRASRHAAARPTRAPHRLESAPSSRRRRRAHSTSGSASKTLSGTTTAPSLQAP